MKMASLVLALTLALAPTAFAAPSCLDRHGEMARCGTAGAMPVGWTPPAAEARARLAARDDGLSAGQLFGLICAIGGLFVLFALLPDFDGGWDRQEDDRERRG